MHRLHFQRMWGRTGFILACLLLFNSIPQESLAWGRSGQRLIANKAVDTLPVEIRPFFEANRAVLFQHVTDPFDSLAKTPAERRNHFIALDKYGRFPFEALPRQYKAALAKFGKPKLDANGLLPWQIGVYSEKLTEAFRAGKWDEARLDASILAHYVAEAHDPFNTTDNFDGHISGQTGIDGRFGTTLIDRYSSFFPMRPNDAVFISDPTDYAFEACLRSHSWLETILLADRNARRGANSYDDEYFDRFYNQAAAILIRQLSDAATDVGSFWLTSWNNAGRPALPH
ncbi:MAG: hypothetical protein DMG35_02675 [Acidobacteria bacterium]|nr:MAG: hypothetical protein DMG35_02675 [Acidobacteriota bacterium]